VRSCGGARVWRPVSVVNRVARPACEQPTSLHPHPSTHTRCADAPTFVQTPYRAQQPHHSIWPTLAQPPPPKHTHTRTHGPPWMHAPVCKLLVQLSSPILQHLGPSLVVAGFNCSPPPIHKHRDTLPICVQTPSTAQQCHPPAPWPNPCLQTPLPHCAFPQRCTHLCANSL
jgi:hypothetical protein